MKKIITIALLLFSVVCFGQRPQRFGQPNLYKYIPWLMTDSILAQKLPTGGTGDSILTISGGIIGKVLRSTVGGGGDTLKVVKSGSGLQTGYVLTPDTLALKTLKADNGLTLTTDSDSTLHAVLGGALTGATTITTGSTTLKLLGTGTPLMLSNSAVSTVNYSLTPNLSAPFYFGVGWTTSAGSYTRGQGIVLDTFNNVYTHSPTISFPGYSNGNTLFVGGNQITGGAEYKRFLVITGNTTLDGTNHIVYVDATGGNVTVTLPAVSAVSTLASSTGVGLVYTIKRIDASINTVTIVPDGSDTIDLTSSLALTSLLSRTIQAAGSGRWFVQ